MGITHYNSHNISSLSFSWTNNDIIHIQNIHTTTYDNQLLDSVRTAMSQVVYYTVEMVLYTGMPHYHTNQLFLYSSLDKL